MTNQTSFRMGTNQKLTISGTSTRSAAFGSQTQVVRLKTTTDCWIMQDGTATPTAAATSGNGWLLLNGDTEYVDVAPGEKIAVIQDATGGTLSIVECTK